MAMSRSSSRREMRRGTIAPTRCLGRHARRCSSEREMFILNSNSDAMLSVLTSRSVELK